MNEREQIEKMARDLCRLSCTCEECQNVATQNKDKCKAKVYAERAYRAGYRRLREARWKGAGMGDYSCSLCNATYSGGNEYNFCPDCGAWMGVYEG